jgi:hypothetical protein
MYTICTIAPQFLLSAHVKIFSDTVALAYLPYPMFGVKRCQDLATGIIVSSPLKGARRKPLEACDVWSNVSRVSYLGTVDVRTSIFPGANFLPFLPNFFDFPVLVKLTICWEMPSDRAVPSAASVRTHSAARASTYVQLISQYKQNWSRPIQWTL